MKKFKKLSDDMEKKVDKFINEECGGWAPRKYVSRYDKYRKDVVDGKIILSLEDKEIFKSIERRRRDEQKIK
jgi:hypothetical protein